MAGGPVYATPTAGVVACYIFNAGSTTATIATIDMYDQNGVEQTKDTDLCGATLGTHQSCSIGSSIAPNPSQNFYACSAKPSGGTFLHGTLDICDQNNKPLQ